MKDLKLMKPMFYLLIAMCFLISTEEPEIDMIITINSDEYRVINFEALTSVDNINVYRQLQLRR